MDLSACDETSLSSLQPATIIVRDSVSVSLPVAHIGLGAWETCSTVCGRRNRRSPLPKMQPVHKTLLEVNEDFLVSEAPAEPLLHALASKRVLTDLDLRQLTSLEPQGARAVKRFVLHVLPLRGPLAYPALLEALQEARAQHLVDLLLEGEAVLQAAVKPIDLPDPPVPPRPPPEDPNDYARKLRANQALIEEAVNPEHVIPVMAQNGVLTSLEGALLDRVRGQRALTWSVLWGVLLQRGPRAYKAFMGALLQSECSALFHTIEETKVTGAEAMKTALDRNTVNAERKKRAEDDQQKDVPEQLHTDRAPVVPPLRLSSRQSAVSARSPEIILNSMQRPHADPLRPGYSVGDLDFLYTPKSQNQMKRSAAGDPAPGSRSVDLLYNPTWADPYNHLRGTDVASPRSAYWGSSTDEGAQNNRLSKSSPYPGYPTTSTDPPLQNPEANEYDHPASTGNAGDQTEAAPLAVLEAIPEQDAESERSNAAVSSAAGKTSPDNTRDESAEKTTDDPGSPSKPPDGPRPPSSPKPDGTQQQRFEPDSSKTTAAPEQKELHEKDSADSMTKEQSVASETRQG